MSSLNVIVLNAVIIHWAVLSSAKSLKFVDLQNLEAQPEGAAESKTSSPLLPQNNVEDHHLNYQLTNIQIGQKKYRPELPTMTETMYPKSYPKTNGDFEDSYQIDEDRERDRYDPKEKETWNKNLKFTDIFDNNHSGQTNSSPEDVSTVIKSKLTSYEDGISGEYNNEPVERPSRGKSVSELAPFILRVVENSLDRTKPQMFFGREDPSGRSSGSVETESYVRDSPYIFTRKVKGVKYMQPDTAEVTYQYKTQPKYIRAVETSVFPKIPKDALNTPPPLYQEQPRDSGSFINKPYITLSDGRRTFTMTSGQPLDSGYHIKA